MENLSSILKQKATERHHRAEVMIAGEQLRYDWGNARGFVCLSEGARLVSLSERLITGQLINTHVNALGMLFVNQDEPA